MFKNDFFITKQNNSNRFVDAIIETGNCFLFSFLPFIFPQIEVGFGTFTCLLARLPEGY
jgi:hypothetical protein